MAVSRMVTRLLLWVAMLILMFGGPSGALAAPGGNAANAQSCQEGGYANWLRKDGTSFKNSGDCASYTARGGELVATDQAALCLTESSDWARSSEFAVPFTSPDECLAYLASGGSIVPNLPGVGTLVATLTRYSNPTNPGAGFCTLDVTITVSATGLW